ncbi:hypothetical protein M2169_001800 [Streptomyces sp. MJP52]|nr:hypothetical protein [Streptomyces sp. MJP52]
MHGRRSGRRIHDAATYRATTYHSGKVRTRRAVTSRAGVREAGPLGRRRRPGRTTAHIRPLRRGVDAARRPGGCGRSR